MIEQSTLVNRMKTDAYAFKLIKHTFESELLQYILNKGNAIYMNNTFDMQLSNLVKQHMNDNLDRISKLSLEDRTGEVTLLFRECALLSDYIFSTSNVLFKKEILECVIH